MNKIEFGDCRETMKRWAQLGIKAQTCVTSPPYFGLRDYGHEGQIGLEPTPDEYIKELVEVFDCVKDVLADDGTLWVNIGDSYASFRDGKVTPDSTRGECTGTEVPKGSAKNRMASTFAGTGIKHKELIGIPWMLAFAMRQSGWYLRQDIIWHKPNPMPESVKDRCTKAHEYIFLFTKQPKYFFDYLAIKEEATTAPAKRNKAAEGYQADYPHGDRFSEGERVWGADGKRNRRDVWSVNLKPYKGAHFAVFPKELIEPCILAGSRENDIVLDPFMGSGTTAEVSLEHKRRFIGCELNEDYKPLQEQRIMAAIQNDEMFA